MPVVRLARPELVGPAGYAAAGTAATVIGSAFSSVTDALSP